MQKIIAHRGYLQPENTLEAFERAVKTGADGIELDTYLSSGGEWLIDHLSRHLPRSPEEKERERTLPHLEELLKLPDCWMNIELKVPVEEKDPVSLGKQLARYIEDTFDTSRINISSFNPKALLGMRLQSKELRLSLLTLYSPPFTWKKWHRKIGLYSFNPFYRLFRRKNISHMHELGMEVHPWTVNRDGAILDLLRAGVDALITDNLELALRIRADLTLD